MSIDHYKECIRAGMKLIPLNGKRPFYKDWQIETDKNRVTNPEDGRLYAHEMGWQIPPGFCVVDVDKPDLFNYPTMEGHTAAQITQSGGSHYLCKLPENVAVEYSHDWGEILTHPRQVRIYGLSKDWLRREVETLPKAFWGMTVTNGSASEYLRYKEYSTDNPGQGQRNNKLTELAGMWWNDNPKTAATKVLKTGQEWGLDEQEISNLIGQMATWKTNHTEQPQPTEPPENAFIRADLLAAKDIQLPTFWQECYGPGQNVQVFGPSGCGKSYYVLDKMYELQRPTAWLDGELTWSMLKHRTTANEWLYMAKPEPNEWLQWDFSEFEVLIIDTKSALYLNKESENSMEHWQQLNQFLTRCADNGLCTVLVHHSGKDIAQMGRGSSAGQSIFDTIIGLTKSADSGRIKVSMKKDRHGLMWPDAYHEMEEQNGRIVFI